MFFDIRHFGGAVQAPGSTPVSMRCPACKKQATLDPLLNVQDMVCVVQPPNKAILFGQRRCPNPSCKAHVFVITSAEKVLARYPPETLDFDATGLPEGVKRAFEEAVTCHTHQCFSAAAMMVRKTLEELCSDKDVKGANLKERLEALGAKIVIPADLISGADHLRLLGNDAAHIEARDYQSIGKEEVEVAIEFAKELLKATYQYSSLLGKLRGLRKTAATTPAEQPAKIN